ncbi:hypothetical protein MWU65_03550 [Cellulophaga sp. F20128]|uniref:hypothetical protein n=1 Tax=Cellulophaga sp. F20128 TaxID=2926413 RepID=UPI001FF698B3|nr:hypothetical protein [Cellulophaga sp. F20128]MCK0156239.1 hypothetical protein [Cellulophaga sp. F20128]
MKKIKVIVLAFFACSALSAQTYLSYGTASSSGGGGGSIVSKLANTTDGVVGSVYLFPTWNNMATVSAVGDKEFQINNLNFNALESTFVSQLSKDTIFTFSGIEKVKVNNKLFVNVNDKFFESLAENSKGERLLKEYVVKYTKPTVHVITNVVTGPAEYKNFENYYMRSADGSLNEIKLNKKEFLKFFGDDSKLVESYAKSHKLKFGNEEDVIQILKYYYHQ